MPPSPSLSRMRYGPRRAPAAKLMWSADYTRLPPPIQPRRRIVVTSGQGLETVSTILRGYRRNVLQVREALESPEAEKGRAAVDGTHLQDASVVERYKRLAIPMRRALNPADRASFVEALGALQPTGEARQRLPAITTAWGELQAELDSPLALGGAKVPRRQILAEWLTAAAFYDSLDKDRAYDRLIDQYGPAIQGICTDLTDDAARVLLLMDEAAAEALGEPVEPEPPEAPPPKPEKETWWKRVF